MSLPREKKGKEIREERKAQQAKTADELNAIIARHFDILEGPNVTAWDIRLAETVSNLIGKQTKVESIKIAYESLRIKNGADYKFLGK
jgi:uncharacterized coiled-coil protein SlyX